MLPEKSIKNHIFEKPKEHVKPLPSVSDTDSNQAKDFNKEKKIQFHINSPDYEANFDKLIPLDHIFKAYKNLKNVITRTPLTKLVKISHKYNANIYIKREDLQIVRSFKLRGAYNKFLSLTEEEKKRGVVCSSAGNHAQGVAYACNQMKVKGNIFMPSDAPDIKVRAVKMFGGDWVNIVLFGDSFDEAYQAAVKFGQENNSVFVHAYDDEKVIAGAGTAAIESLEDFNGEIDYFFLPIGGGGIAAGMSSYIKQMSPQTKIIGCEPFGCPSMVKSLQTGKPEQIKGINTFIDGAAVGTPGKIPSRILKETLQDIILVKEGICCTSLLEMFQSEGIVCEPAGALCVAALEYYKEEIRGKNIVCMVSGSNNDLTRMTDIKILSEIEQGTRYYFLINFQQKFGALKEFITSILSEDDEILSIDYKKKQSSQRGASLVGINVKKPENVELIKMKLEQNDISYKILSPDDEIFKFLL